MKYDVLIVGAGFSGAVIAERISSVLDKKVLLIDRRDHIAGNCYDYRDENGILIHKYGPHIFHTVNKKVWNYLSGFTEWHPYSHEVLAVIKGKKVPVPFNLNSIHMSFDKPKAEELEALLLTKYGDGAKIPILKLMESDNKILKELAEYIYNNVFLGYTVKQWGLKPEELDMSVTSRIPVYISRDNRYFQDTFQAIPKNGYTELFNNLLKSDKIDIRLNTEFNEISAEEYDKIVYSGPIDSYFNYKFGRLPYRSLRFKLETYESNFYQERAQVNYPNDNEYTRITEFKHFLDYRGINNTTIAKEYSEEFCLGSNEPYYPIPNNDNNELFKKYKEEAEKSGGKVFFIGRLADYKYYNMDQVVGVALQFFDKNIAKF